MSEDGRLSRRDLLGRSLTIGAAALGAESSRASSQGARAAGKASARSRKPNVLVIMADQHRRDLMTCAGTSFVETPNMDRIAARGVRVTNTYCSYPVCAASRMSLLTGLYPHNHRVINNTDRLGWRVRTVVRAFAEEGYLTGLAGKMHFNDSHTHGFEYYVSINDWLMYLGPKVPIFANEIANDPYQPEVLKTVYDDGAGLPIVQDAWNGRSPWAGHVRPHDFVDLASKLEAEDHLDSFLARETVRFIEQPGNRPFFYVVSFMKPHAPFFPPKEWARRYPVDKVVLPAVGDISGYPIHLQERIKYDQSLGDVRHRAHRAGYLGNLAFVDTCIGMVYKALETAGLLDDTIVVFTSDHGEMGGDHGLFEKMCMFEPSIGVPLIVSYPPKIPRGKVAKALIEHVGLYPTLLELAGCGTSGKVDGKSFASLLMNPELKGPEAAFCEYALKSRVAEYKIRSPHVPEYMVRTERYKYVYNDGSTHELYDEEADPGEKVNLIDKPGMKAIRDGLHDRLFAWYDPSKNPFRTAR